MFSKSDIRSHIREQREQMPAEQIKKKSDIIIAKILELEEYRSCDTIYLYAPIDNEVDVLPLLRDALLHNKRVGCPVCLDATHMEFYEVFDEMDLQPGRYGILEPPQDILLEDQTALMILPAVAYDRRKNRIGQGGGYYDRYLERYPDLTKLGVAYDFQIVDAFDSEAFDQKVDLVITDVDILL